MLSYFASQTTQHTWPKIKKIFRRIFSRHRQPAQPAQEHPEKFKVFNVKDPLQDKPVEEIRKWQQSVSIPYSVAIYNTVRDFNLASIIRNASAFGLKEVNIIGFKKFDKRGAVGSYNYVKINHFMDFEAFSFAIKPQNIIALELPEHYPQLQDSFTELYDFEWVPGQCILIGEEGAGIPEEDLIRCAHKVKMTIPGSMRSLNAATAAGIAMYSISRHNAMMKAFQHPLDAGAVLGSIQRRMNLGMP